MLNFLQYQYLPPNVKEELKNANVFMSREYASFINKLNRQYYYFFNEDFILPIEIFKKPFHKVGRIYSEVYRRNLDRLDDYSERAFLDDVINILKTKFKLMCINQTATTAILEVIPSNSKYIPFGTYELDLSLEEDTLLNNIHSKHRNSIVRAERNGVQIRRGQVDLIDDLYYVLSHTYRRSNMFLNEKSYFEDLIRTLNSQSIIFAAYKDNAVQGAALFFYNSQRCYYMYGGSIDSPEPGAMNLLHWMAILYMKRSNVRVYDFVGARLDPDKDSKYYTMQRFKERFGAQIKEGYMFKCVLNEFQHNAYTLAKHLVKKKWQKDIIDQESHKYLNIL
ncbi:MAG: lipid II:glycine glycyltransferase FemX [Deltaproteobacteria bacterium]